MITIDNHAGSVAVFAPTQDTHTWSHTVTVSNMLFVQVANITSASVTDVTYNGATMTSLGVDVTDYGYGFATFYLVSPDTGTHDVVVTYNMNVAGSLGVSYSVIGAITTIDPNNIALASYPATTLSGSLPINADDAIYFIAMVSDKVISFSHGETVIEDIDIGSAYMKLGYKYSDSGNFTIGGTIPSSGTMFLTVFYLAPIISDFNALFLTDGL